MIRRLATDLLVVVLSALLAWCLIQGVGDVRTIIYLCLGIFLGAIYTFNGQLPSWLFTFTGGSLTADDDPANIPPRVYLPIIAVVILIAVIVFFVFI